LAEKGFLYFLLIDPEKPGDLSNVVRIANKVGVSAFMLGGSTAVVTEQYEEVISQVKRSSSLPVIIFPSNSSSIARGADAIWFMSLLNSEDAYWIIGAQALGIPAIKRLKLEAIPMGYLIVGTGGTAGFVGRARPIPQETPEIAVAYTMAAEALGMRFVYLEAGSGVESPIGADFVTTVRRPISVPVIVGGGITSGKTTEELIAAGADAIVTGNLFERAVDVEGKMLELIEGCKRGVLRRSEKNHNISNQ
jgi:phosphoglycerol geranylgeranyltransferase